MCFDRLLARLRSKPNSPDYSKVPVADTEAGWSDDNGDEETWDDWGSGDPEAPSGAPIDSSGGSPSGGAAASSSGNSIAGAELVGTVQSPTVGGMTAAGSGVRAAPNGAGAAAAAGAGGASAHLPRPGGPTVRPTPGAPMDSVSPTATAGASSSVEAPAVNFFDELGMKPVVTKAKRIAAPNVSAAATTSRFAMDTLIDDEGDGDANEWVDDDLDLDDAALGTGRRARGSSRERKKKKATGLGATRL